MVRLTSKEKGTKRFIRSRGRKVAVEAVFITKQAAKAGDDTIRLYETLGLLPGTKFSLPVQSPLGDYTQELEVKEAHTWGVTLTGPVLSDIPEAAVLQLNSEVYALFTSPGRDITRDTIESNRRVRVPSDTVISYGSVVQSGVNRYYVSGYQEGDSSLSIGLKIINEHIDIYTPDPSFEVPVESPKEPEEDLEDVTGWLSPKDQVAEEVKTATKNWPTPRNMTLLRGGIEAYQEQQSLYGDLEEPGQIPSLNRFYLIPAWIPVKVGDYIKTEEATMRILGIDLTRVRNMQALYVNYYRGADVGEDELEEPEVPDIPEEPDEVPPATEGGTRHVHS